MYIYLYRVSGLGFRVIKVLCIWRLISCTCGSCTATDISLHVCAVADLAPVNSVCAGHADSQN